MCAQERMWSRVLFVLLFGALFFATTQLARADYRHGYQHGPVYRFQYIPPTIPGIREPRVGGYRLRPIVQMRMRNAKIVQVIDTVGPNNCGPNLFEDAHNGACYGLPR